MGYRSLKRVLGETSLERKCRLLFGTCLLILIGGTFYGVDRIAERLVIESTRSKGSDLVDTIMIKKHALAFRTEPPQGLDERLSSKEFLQLLFGDIEKNQNYDHQVKALSDEFAINGLESHLPEDAEEEQLLRALKAEYEAQVAAEEQREKSADEGPSAELVTPLALAADVTPTVVFRDRRRRDRQNNEYYDYYEPVIWKNSICYTCHADLPDMGALPLSETAGIYGPGSRFRAIRVSIPYKETQDAITRARAILIAVAILTVFAAMVALYMIVRYVIVKPLKHLRDVSDDVSRGNTDLRAEIHTNDEFEDLAASFNRMLRHLIDAQTELKQVNVDLDAKVDQLAQLNMQLYEMNRLKGDFLANMSHELRTPLNSIIGFSEVLQGIDSLNDKQKRYALNIQKSGRVLLEMINDILDLAKMEAGKMEVRPSEFRIGAVVMAQCDMVRSLTEEKNIDLKVEVEPNAPPMYQDQAKVQQILTNLLSNAIKFTPEGGRITVTAFADERDHLRLTVADTGVGIATEDRDIIFEKFRQSRSVSGQDGLTREFSGTGLGLSIVKELCKLLGGEISFESELGIGSTFQVVLPWNCPPRAPVIAEFPGKLDQLTLLHRGAADDEDGAAAPSSRSKAVPAAASSNADD